MAALAKKYKGIPVVWMETDDVEFPYAARVNNENWRLRINDFPIEPLFTLFINDEEIGHLDDWPPYWKKQK